MDDSNENIMNLKVDGPMICRGAVCRCDQPGKKSFCDASHKRRGFNAS